MDLRLQFHPVFRIHQIMVMFRNKFTEKQGAIISVLFGFLVALLISIYPLFETPPRMPYFIINFSYYWVSQVIVLGFIWLFNARFGVIAGTSVLITLFLMVFEYRQFTSTHPESLAWLLYFFCFPGIAVGAIISDWLMRMKQTHFSAIAAFAVSFVFAGIGLVLTLLYLFSRG